MIEIDQLLTIYKVFLKNCYNTKISFNCCTNYAIPYHNLCTPNAHTYAIAYKFLTKRIKTGGEEHILIADYDYGIGLLEGFLKTYSNYV